MPADRAELSSLQSSLAQLVERVTGLADAAQRDRDEKVAGDLFAVERSLVSARRRLERMLAER